MPETLPAWIREVRWNADGLAPAIAQDYRSGRLLMLAWVNAQSLALSIEEGRAIYWSRSRSALWRKGESSGNVQKLHRLQLDCDSDAILMQVEQVGGIACHTGRESCFYRELQDGSWTETEPVLRDPKELYGA